MTPRTSGRSPLSRLRAPHRDRELEAGTNAHYEDPAYYTKTYRRRVDDVRYYADLAAATGGPVLEYGCGNGRITMAIARRGVQVVGVDRSRPMLGDLEKQLAAEPAARDLVTLRRGDMRSVRLSRRFPLVICPFNALLHLYTRRDFERFAAMARAHLTPRGQFVFDVSMPDPAELARHPSRAYRTPGFVYPDANGGTRVRYAERFDYDRLRQVLFVAMEFAPLAGERWMTPLAHRQFYPEELEALLHYNGFKVTERYGDFFYDPLTRHSGTMVFHCRKGSLRARP